MTAILPHASSGYYPDGSDTAGSTSIKKEALAASRSSSRDVSITTREGDVVTLSSESFKEFKAFSYDGTGRVGNGDGSACSCLSYRSMELSSGSSFTFSVEGDLSQGELDDIEKIMVTLDKIMEEMTSGDMDGAMDLALGMDGYETVSEFSADLSCSRSYAAVREYARTESLPTHGKEKLPETENITQSLFDEMEAAVNSAPRGDKLSGMKERSGISTLLDQMTRVLEKEGKENQRQVARPVDQLFGRQLGRMAERDRRGDTPLFKELEAARAEMQDRIHRMWSQPMEMLRS